MSSPRIWLVTGEKHGDNAQAERLADVSGLAYERRRIVLKPGFDLAKPRIEASLHHVDLQASDELGPPWPDLVLTIGQRLAMAALWIRDQSQGRTKLALIGQPRSGTESFDLIIVPFQFRSEQRPNILRIGLPLLGIDHKRLAAEAERWKPSFAHLPRPLTVLLCGGSVSGHSFDPETAKAILAAISRVDGSGSLQVVASRRTSAETARTLADALPPGAAFHSWQAAGSDNPYFGLLALGDRFVVTGDSISMLVEVARTGKPLAIAPLRPAHRKTAALFRRLQVPETVALVAAGAVQRAKDRVLAFTGQEAQRDFAPLHDLMYENGWAVPLGKPFLAPANPPVDDVMAAAERLRQLVG